MAISSMAEFQRINIRDDRRRAHVARRIAIRVHDVHLRGDRAKCIELCTVLNARDDVWIWPRTNLPAFVAVANELAIGPRAKLNVMTRLGAIGRNRKALGAGCDQFYRPVQPFGGECDQCRARNPFDPKAPPT